jgi:transcription elongation GreA/GreB family factor
MVIQYSTENMSQTNIDKRALVALIIDELKQELNQAISAANEAHAAAVDDQSVAETQYDTLAIEASYLAEGQSRRVQELQAAINDYQALNLLNFDENKSITLSALVQLGADSQDQHWFFIGPAAGGFRCQLAEQHITVITPKSPMGLALIDKFQDDDIEVMLGNSQLTDHIAMIG